MPNYKLKMTQTNYTNFTDTSILSNTIQEEIINVTMTTTLPVAMETRTISLGIFIFVCVCATFGFTMTISFLIFNLVHKNDRMIKMSSPNINVLITIGGAILFICAVLFGLDFGITGDVTLASIFCQIRTWLVVIGFTLVYGSIFSKSWRVYRIFTRAPIKRTVIRDDKLLLLVFLMLMVDVIILSFWQGFDPIQCDKYITEVKLGPRRYNDPPSAPDEVIIIQVCQSNYTYIWIILIYFYKAGLLLFGTYLSWATRNVTLPSMNDAKSIIVSVYTCVILVAVVTGLSTVLVAWPNAWYACVATAILVCTTEVLLMQNVPKIYAWKHTSSADLSRSITTSYLATTQNNTVDRIEEDYFMLSADNAQLKKALAEKEETIKTLQRHVDTAKEKLMKIEIEHENRQDSGCDADMSSSSTQDDIDHESVVKGQTSSTNTKTHRTDSRRRLSFEKIPFDWFRRKPRDRSSIRSDRSVMSMKSWKQFTEMRNSIADDLHKAHNLSSGLRDSISRDLNRLRRRPLSVYSNVEIEKQLADTLRDCYRLSEADADSMISVPYTCTYENPSFERGYQPRSFEDTGSVSDTDDMYCSCSCGHQHSRTSSFRSTASRASVASRTSRFSRNSIQRRHSLPMRYRPGRHNNLSEENLVQEAPKQEVVKSSLAFTRKIGTDTYV